MSAETSTTAPGAAAASVADEQHKKDRLELIIAILLGIVSIGIAYASFQAALYDSEMAGDYQRGTALAGEAESLYLEGNQTYVQDAQLWNELSKLTIESESTNPDVAAQAQTTFDVLMFQSVSEDLAAAAVWADAENTADPENYYSPLDSEEYLAALFGGYHETKAQADAAVVEGDEANSLSDRLTLYTVLMSVSLFLLGIAAVVRQYRVQLLLVITGSAIFAISVILTAMVPFIGL
jgi:hypothetical protein